MTAVVVRPKMTSGMGYSKISGAANSPASWLGVSYNARAGTIYAGTSQIQRTVIAERVLGLPREPAR